MRNVVITGGIGTGKSTVCRLLEQWGVVVLDADTTAHQLLDEHADWVTKTFGAACVSEGKVNRQALGAIVFSDPQARATLEAFLHPKIRTRLLEAKKTCEAKGEQCVLDIPLFYETQGAYPNAVVAVVYATPAQQKARVMARNRWSEEEALARIGAQLPIEEKRQKADFVITNTADKAALVEEVKRFYAWLKDKNASE